MEEAAPHTPHEVLVEWRAFDRPFRKRSTQFYFNVAAITVLIFLILFFFVQYALIAVLFSIAFVGLALATVPPQMITYKITTDGLSIGEKDYKWDIIQGFWQTESLGYDMIILPITLNLPKQLIMLPDPTKKAEITKILAENVSELDPPKLTWFDKTAQSLVKLVNLGVKNH